MPDKFSVSRHEVSPALSAIIAINEASAYLRDYLDRAVAPLGVTGGQYIILRILKRAAPGGLNRAEMLGRIIDKRADLTRQLDGLDRLGFIVRTRPDNDRRIVISTITPAGEEALERIDHVFRETLVRLDGLLAAEQWNELVRLCRAVTENS